jgi:UDP-N-acetylmuramoylalanine--D-glutamate ligase
MTIQPTHFLILGLARSGKATADYFDQIGEAYVLYDDHAQSYGDKSVLNSLADIAWDAIKCVIQSPGVPFSYPKPHPVTAAALARNIPIKTDIDLFNTARDKSAPCIGITGTNGKSTTTALVTHILNAAGRNAVMGGNIGVPVLSLFGDSIVTNPAVTDYVLELSSFQLETTHRIDLDIAVITNIGDDHIDRHGTMENYVAAKKRIFDHANIQITGANCPDPAFDFKAVERLPGAHNHENIKIAYAVCTHLGVPHDVIVAAIHRFPGLSHRMERVYTCSDFFIINDSKATNAESVQRALEHYTANPNIHIYWIAGGRPKIGGIESLKPYFSNIKKAYFIGESQDAFLKTTQGLLDASTVGDLESAVKAAFADIRAEARANTCQGRDLSRQYLMLFSPACASYDQFRDFEHRGDEFKKIALANLSSKAKKT